jgi:hypothetical protein
MRALFDLHKLKDIKTYQYIGFGSYTFDDFKLLHNHIGISNLISLESDYDLYKRANYNKPYKCITIINKTSTDFISDFNKEYNLIFWLDYSNPRETRAQFSDFSSLIIKMEPGDIVRITLNANPTTLGGDGRDAEATHKHRLTELRSRIEEFVPLSANTGDMIKKNYPILLLSCLEVAAHRVIQPNAINRKALLPIFSTVYADGQQMVTLTAIMVNAGEQEKIKEQLSFHYASFKWHTPCYIQIPPLTTQEIININKLLPHDDRPLDCTQRICTVANCRLYAVCPFLAIKRDFYFAFKSEGNDADKAIKSYIDYYKYYPNFHHITL